ncbi:uncharacterized protein EV422DRAFT_45388 [Fimicolochytrium jonesii]|uniref:uncharacterized protein n=1 Tax=Fimicolochytrium jonesii TaxID=1396493 RepID=UPI0022FF3D06|nr:uncharacterized protein EV422DRAFT_45388 [Fimicolochytrium jonesii]KAI8821515.1 hypothetical protein EV422DRAFT_45388 [Fimicolochytrium jonesii]
MASVTPAMRQGANVCIATMNQRLQAARRLRYAAQLSQCTVTLRRRLFERCNSSSSSKGPLDIEITYRSRDELSEILRTHPTYKAKFLSRVASIPELARAYRDLDEHIKKMGYASAREPTRMPDAATVQRMQKDQILVEKSLAVQRLLQVHGIVKVGPAGVKVVPKREDKPGPDLERAVKMVRGVVPAQKGGLPPPTFVPLSKPMQWFKSVFMTTDKPTDPNKPAGSESR